MIFLIFGGIIGIGIIVAPITVRHDDGTWEYHFGDADPGEMEEGAPITVWTYPEIRGLDRRRTWHAVQAGRVIRDHGPTATVERRIRLVLAPLMPLLIGGAGGWRGATTGRVAGRTALRPHSPRSVRSVRTGSTGVPRVAGKTRLLFRSIEPPVYPWLRRERRCAS